MGKDSEHRHHQEMQMKTTTGGKPPHTCQDGCHQSSNRPPGLARMWSKRTAHALLAGLQVGAPPTENNTGFLKTLEVELPYNPTVTLPRV